MAKGLLPTLLPTLSPTLTLSLKKIAIATVNVIVIVKNTMPMKKYMSIASFSAAILFAAVGMAIPPQGVIDGSVLILAAQLFVLCATFLGIKDLSLPKKA